MIRTSKLWVQYGKKIRKAKSIVQRNNFLVATHEAEGAVETAQDDLQSCGGGGKGFIQRPVLHDIVVMHVHKNGQRLSQNNG